MAISIHCWKGYAVDDSGVSTWRLQAGTEACAALGWCPSPAAQRSRSVSLNPLQGRRTADKMSRSHYQTLPHLGITRQYIDRDPKLHVPDRMCSFFFFFCLCLSVPQCIVHITTRSILLNKAPFCAVSLLKNDHLVPVRATRASELGRLAS